jgi:hypothetical protein
MQHPPEKGRDKRARNPDEDRDDESRGIPAGSEHFREETDHKPD